MEPKGLTNPKGANNCWLNATVQEKSAIFFKLEQQIFYNKIDDFFPFCNSFFGIWMFFEIPFKN